MYVKMCNRYFLFCIGQFYVLDFFYKLKEEYKFDVILIVESGGFFMM